MTNCKNCSNEVSLNYCSSCGQPVTLKRIDAHYILHEVEHVLHFEKGILYTVKELLIRPGENVRMFLSDNRNRLVKPIIFIIITSLIYTVISHFFHIEEEYVDFQGAEKSSTTVIFQWVQNHYGYANIIMGIFISLWVKLFFRKSGYNFFEILILMCFIMGMGMLLYSLFAMAQGLTGIEMMQLAGALGFIYCSWAIGQFFNKSKISAYLKAVAAYLFGMITFTFIAVLTGFLADLILKH